MFNKVSRTMNFKLDLSNVVNNNELDSGDPDVKAFEAQFTSDITRDVAHGILVVPRK
jgi:hypothetical protein